MQMFQFEAKCSENSVNITHSKPWEALLNLNSLIEYDRYISLAIKTRDLTDLSSRMSWRWWQLAFTSQT